MFNNINLNLYKDFYLVCKYGSINKAAKESYTSPPAISKSIKKLESELNRQLFYRNSDGMMLTSYGKKLLFYVEESFNSLNVAERTLVEEDTLKKGSLNIGIPSNIGSFFLFDNLIKFHNEYPNIDVTVVTGSTSKLIELLKSHTVDFVIDTSPINIELSNDYTIKELAKVNYCFTASKDFDTSKIKKLEDLEKYQLILPIKGTANRNDLDELIKEKNINFNNPLNFHTSEMIISAVKNNIGIGYVIGDLITKESDLKIVNIDDKLPNVKINIIYNSKYLTVAPKKFINMYIDKTIN